MSVVQRAINLTLAPADQLRLGELIRKGNASQHPVQRTRIALLRDSTHLNGVITWGSVSLPALHRGRRWGQEQEVDELLHDRAASRLNAVEVFFAKSAAKHLHRGSFRSIVDLQAAIGRFIADNNTMVSGFV